MTPGAVHRSSTVLLSVAMMLIGVVFFVQAVTGHKGAVVRVLLGLLFLAAGLGRIYIESRRSKGT